MKSKSFHDVSLESNMENMRMRRVVTTRRIRVIFYIALYECTIAIN